MRKIPFIFCLLVYLGTSAQVIESFSDGNFTVNPAWTGNTGDWVVNSAGQLQSNNTTPSSTFYLSTPSTLSVITQWEFFIRLNFNTSSANSTDVFLTASAADLSAGSTTGYFVRIGNTGDEIALYRKDVSGVIKIIDGIDGITNTSDNIIKIKVTRDAANTFMLYRDITGSGLAYTTEGAASDALYTTSSFFGILVRQSTSSFFQRHYIDDISVQDFIPDLTPPVVLSATPLSANTLHVLFSEPVDLVTSQVGTNYFVDNGIGRPLTAERDAANAALVHLTFSSSFSNALTHTLTVNGIKDLSGNTLVNGTTSFSFFTIQRFDVVIHEIMADPAPVVSLPNAEYLELKNTSGRSINLQGWRIATSTALSSGFTAYVLPADSFLIITSAANAALFSSYGRVLPVASFPTLNNEGTTVSLLSKNGMTIHAVAYNTEWYGHASKRDGGWSLEMIDAANPCGGKANWNAATDSKGGTPGVRNSVARANKDETPPALIRTYAADSVTIFAVFDESLDSSSASVAANYTITGGFSVLHAVVIPPLFNTVQLSLSAPIHTGIVYTVIASNVRDCKDNGIGTRNTAKTGIAQTAAVGDIIINELLFNPKPGGYDYVELYNRSAKIIDVSKLFITSRNNAGTLSTLRRLSATPFYIFPGDYIVLTEDRAALGMHYFVKDETVVLQLATMPSLPDDKGTAVVINEQSLIIDEVNYRDDWHFGLLANAAGVSLERIDSRGPSQDKNNWHSAASAAGYGTPGYQNSQFNSNRERDEYLEISPKIFSPDNDGTDDFLTIRYSTTENGYVANILIFDAGGREVRKLVRNHLLGTRGSWTWDGLGEQKQKLPIGTYVVYTELFNLQGKKISFKKAVVLASRLN